MDRSLDVVDLETTNENTCSLSCRRIRLRVRGAFSSCRLLLESFESSCSLSFRFPLAMSGRTPLFVFPTMILRLHVSVPILKPPLHYNRPSPRSSIRLRHRRTHGHRIRSYHTPNRHEETKCSTRADHVLAQCPKRSLWSSAEANDVCCAEDESNNEANGCEGMVSEAHVWRHMLTGCKVGARGGWLRTSAHHGTHFRYSICQYIACILEISDVCESGTPLSTAEGALPAGPPAGIALTGGMIDV